LGFHKTQGAEKRSAFQGFCPMALASFCNKEKLKRATVKFRNTKAFFIFDISETKFG
jgi:hypothetical protein